MRLRLACARAVALALPASRAAAPGLQGALSGARAHAEGERAAGYVGHVRPAAASRSRRRSPSQIVDPVGGVHPVEYGDAHTKFVTNVPFKGTFRDFVRFPPRRRGSSSRSG